MYRFILSIILCLSATAVLHAQQGCCDNNYKAGKKALDEKKYNEAIRFFTQGRDCGDRCSYNFNALIQEATNHRDEKVVTKPIKSKPKPNVSTEPSPSTRRTVTTFKYEPEMVFVQGGTFQMGCTSEQGSDCESDEKPTHQVTLSSYQIGKYEITQWQWREVMGQDPPELKFKGCDDCPVERVSWDDIQQFLKKLNNRTSKNYRLPTEAEWEFAARGGTRSNGYKYSGSNSIGNVAWFTDNSNNKTHPIGQKQANELGIFDMTGNVWEWCSDWYGTYNSAAVSNPTGATKGTARVARGGSWNRYAQCCRVADRNYYAPTIRDSDLGFRVILSP